MKRICIFALLAAACISSPIRADEAGDALYTAKAIVTGTGETNRQPGLRDCLDQVVLRVSADQRLLRHPKLATLREHAGSFVHSILYRDRLAGRPIHDEQGTYDRPHDLTCRYEKDVVDRLLADLGSSPWLAPRPKLFIVLDVKRENQAFRVDEDGVRDQDMRESFANAAAPLAMQVVFPAAEDAAPSSSAEGVLKGSLVWSDADLGWLATWRLTSEGKSHYWEVKGVNFDEAFRVAMRGAAQILSGNGQPE